MNCVFAVRFHVQTAFACFRPFCSHKCCSHSPFFVFLIFCHEAYASDCERQFYNPFESNSFEGNCIRSHFLPFVECVSACIFGCFFRHRKSPASWSMSSGLILHLWVLIFLVPHLYQRCVQRLLLWKQLTAFRSQESIWERISPN